LSIAILCGQFIVPLLYIIYILFKKAVRIITHSTRKAHTAPLFYKLQILPIFSILRFTTGQFYVFCYSWSVAGIFNQYVPGEF